MGCSTILKEMHLLKGALTSKRCITPFQGNPQSVWTYVNSKIWANNVNLKICSTHSLAAYVFAFVQHSFWKIT